MLELVNIKLRKGDVYINESLWKLYYKSGDIELFGCE